MHFLNIINLLLKYMPYDIFVYIYMHISNLAGKYGDNTFGKGLVWGSFNGDTNSLRRATMMIRPKTN